MCINIVKTINLDLIQNVNEFMNSIRLSKRHIDRIYNQKLVK